MDLEPDFAGRALRLKRGSSYQQRQAKDGRPAFADGLQEVHAPILAERIVLSLLSPFYPSRQAMARSLLDRVTSITLRCILMIKSFKHRGLKRLYERGDRSGIRPDLLETVKRILTVLDNATTPQALDIPGYRLHPLKGDSKGFWSVTVRANWRMIFRFEGTDVFEVELIDYH